MVVDVEEGDLVPLASHYHEHGVEKVKNLGQVKDVQHTCHAAMQEQQESNAAKETNKQKQSQLQVRRYTARGEGWIKKKQSKERG